MNFQTSDRRCRNIVTVAPVVQPTEYERFLASFLQTTSVAQVLLLIHALKKRRVINFFKKYIALSVFETYTKLQMSYILQNQLFRLALTTEDAGDTLVLTIGNTSYGNYSKNGGSRLILGLVEKVSLLTSYPNVNNPKYTSSYAPNDCYTKYANLDFTKPVSMSFDFDLSYLRPGVVACVYLVPMKKHIDEENLSSYYTYSGNSTYAKTYVEETLLQSSTDDASNRNKMLEYADECGMGYNDAQGVGMGSSIEIDCIEATPCGLSVTLHGKNEGGGYDTGGVWCNVHNNMSTTGASLSKKINSDAEVSISGVDLSTYGPSSNYFINTLLLFNVEVETSFASLDILTMVVKIKQTINGQLHQLKLTVTSAGFPKDEGLGHMNVVVSLWMSPVSNPFDHDTNTSWWLDGYKIDPNNTLTSVRGPCRESNYGAIPTVSKDPLPEKTVSGGNLLPAIYQNYSDYAIPVVLDANRAAYSPSIFILRNMNISPVANYTANSLPVYVQDFMYRGQGGGGGKPEYFTGRYDSAYGVTYMSNQNEINTNKFIPVVSDIVDNSLNYINQVSSYYQYQLNGNLWGGDYSFGGKLNMNDVSLKEIVGFCKTPADGQTTEQRQADFAAQHEIGSFFFDAPNVMINGRSFQ